MRTVDLGVERMLEEKGVSGFLLYIYEGEAQPVSQVNRVAGRGRRLVGSLMHMAKYTSGLLWKDGSSSQ